MNFLIVAAKTGGHVFPAAAVSKDLITMGHNVVVVGIGSHVEKKAFSKLNSSYFIIPMDGFRGKNIHLKVKVLFQVILNIFRILKIIKEEKIDAMIGFGGFITVPAGIATRIKKKPLFIHEQNAVLGSANKILHKISKISFMGMPIRGLENAILSGNPIRTSFIADNKSQQIPDSPVNIYITGGSQGAEYINENIPIVLKNFHNINVIHQCGKNNSDKVKKLYQDCNFSFEVNDFYSNPEENISWSDFVITRGGALSLAEITSMKRGMLIIPLPNAIDNHQYENSKIILNSKIGIIHQQKEPLETLQQKIENIIESKIYQNWKNNVNNDHINATKIIANSVHDFLNKK
mgnify:FL=1